MGSRKRGFANLPGTADKYHFIGKVFDDIY